MSGDDSNPSKNQWPGINRRDLAKLLAGGAGAGLLASIAKGQKPPLRPPVKSPPPTVQLGNSAVVQWTDTLLAPAVVVTGACYYNGIVAVASQNGAFATVICSDIHDGALSQGIPNVAGYFQTPVGFQGNTIATLNNGSNIAFLTVGDVNNTGTITPPAARTPQSNLLPIYGGDALAYVDISGNLTAIQITGDEQYTILWSGPAITGALGSLTLSQATNSLLVITNYQGTVTVMNIAGASATNPPQVLTTISNLGYQPLGASADGNNIYLISYVLDNTTQKSYYQLSAISLSNYSSLWSTPLSSQPSPPLSINGILYFVDAGGAFRSVDAGTGTPGWFTAVPGCDNTTPFYAEDGNAYICSPAGILYGFALLSQGANAVTYNMGSESILLGVENSICFVLNQNGAAVSGVDVAGEIHGFSCDSTLMADNYVAGTGPTAPATEPDSPAYTSVILLLDPNNNPRTYKNVRIQASDTTTIMSGGQTYSLNPNGSLWLTTDGGGYLTIVTPATDVQSPALYLWSDFMARTESLVIYPDHATINSLAAKQGSDYQSATAFDGSSVLASMGSGGPDPNQVAMSIANTLGSGSVVPPPTSYSSYTASSTNLAYQPSQGSTARSFSPGSSETAYTDITNGAVTYTPGPPPASPVAAAASFLGFDDFKNDIVKGTKKIGRLAVDVGNDVVHTITAVTGEIYQFTVTAIEDAINVVSGFIRSIIADIGKAVEWLSQIFSWKDIVATHTAIKTYVMGTAQQVRSYINTDIASLQMRLDTFFSDAQQTVQQAVNNINSQIGGQTLQSQQQNGNDPKAGYNANGASGYAPSNSMTSKTRTNQKKSKNVKLGPAVPLSLLQVQQKAEGYITGIPAALGSTLQDLKNAIDTFLDTFKLLVTDPTKFVKHAFEDFLVVLGDVAAVVLKALNIVIDIVLGDIADLLDTTLSLITGTVDIPIISELFQLIFGGPVTFLDLAAWLIAIPTSIVMNAAKLGSSLGSSGRLGSSNPNTQQWAYLFSNFIGCLFDADNDAMNANAISAVNILDLAVGCITYGLSCPSSFNGNDPLIFYYAFGSVPLLISTINIVLAANGSAAAEGFNLSTYVLVTAYGLFNMISGVFNSFTNPAEFSDPDHLTLCQNIFSNCGLISKFLAYAYRPALAVMDIICPTTAGGLGLAVAIKTA